MQTMMNLPFIFRLLEALINKISKNMFILSYFLNISYASNDEFTVYFWIAMRTNQ